MTRSPRRLAAFTEVATADQSRLVAYDALRTPSGLTNRGCALATESQLIVVIDQLEELWTATDAEERSGFAAALGELERSDADVRMVATVRADWFDRPLRDPSLGPLVARGTFGVTPMATTELYEAIVEPAAKVGVRFESGLAGRIIAEALDQPGSLPLLQFALTELFDRREGSTVTMQAYDEIGGLSGSVRASGRGVVRGPLANRIKPPFAGCSVGWSPSATGARTPGAVRVEANWSGCPTASSMRSWSAAC